MTMRRHDWLTGAIGATMTSTPLSKSDVVRARMSSARRQLRDARRCLAAARLVGLVVMGLALSSSLAGDRWLVVMAALGGILIGATLPIYPSVSDAQRQLDDLHEGWEIPQ